MTTLRADAERNRQRILEAARVVFAQDGIDAPLAAVARRAGVGVATLFRRFPTRDELVTAAFADRMMAYAAVVRRAQAHPDPWLGFQTYVLDVCAMQVGNRGFMDVLSQSFPHARTFEAQRQQSFASFADLVARAKASGGLRDDFSTEDLPLVLMASAGVMTAMDDAAPDAWRRIVGYLLQSFAAPGATVTVEPLPDAPTPRQMTRALARLRVRAKRPTANREADKES